MLEGTLNTAQSNPKLRISYLLVTLVLFDADAQLTLGSGCGWWRLATVLLAVGLLTSVIAWCSDVLFDRRPAAVVPVPAAVDINAGRRQNMPVEGEVIGRIVAEALALRRLPADLPRQNAAAARYAPRRRMPVIPENFPPPVGMPRLPVLVSADGSRPGAVLRQSTSCLYF